MKTGTTLVVEENLAIYLEDLKILYFISTSCSTSRKLVFGAYHPRITRRKPLQNGIVYANTVRKRKCMHTCADKNSTFYSLCFFKCILYSVKVALFHEDGMGNTKEKEKKMAFGLAARKRSETQGERTAAAVPLQIPSPSPEGRPAAALPVFTPVRRGYL